MNLFMIFKVYLSKIISYLYFEIKAFLYVCFSYFKVKICFSVKEQNKLEFGIGTNPKKEGFITSDLSIHTDYPFDLRLGLPFPDKSIDLIYSEHVLEHFDYQTVYFILQECYRTMRTNAKMLLAVPDVKPYIDNYLSKAKPNYKNHYYYDWGLPLSNKIDFINYVFYLSGQHKYMFDEESLVDILQSIGFSSVKLRDFMPGIDSEKHRYDSIFVECVKSV